MLSVKGSSPDYTPNWSEKLVLEFLQKFLHKEHWEQIDKSVFNFENDTPFSQRDEARRIVKKAMDHCNMALDVYGTAQCLLDDLKVYFNSWMYTEINYKDSQLLQYVPKSRILEYIVKDFYENGGFGQFKIVDLYILKMTEKFGRSMSGTYELISRTWLDAVKPDFTDIISSLFHPEVSKIPPVFRELVAQFAQFFDDNNDPQLLSSLEEILRPYVQVSLDEKVPMVFNSLVNLYSMKGFLKAISSWLIPLINENPYMFLSFAESKKLLGAQFPVEPPVIRLICHNDEKFLFVKDVETAIRRVLESGEEERVLPKDLFNLESDKDRKKGIFHTISHSEYLKILETMKLDVASITLVNENIVKTRHRTVPIISPYNTQCIPVVEVFDELLSILTIGMQFWRKIQPKNMGKVQKKFEEVCQMFMDPAKPRYFMEIGRVEQLGELLRKSVAPLLEKDVVVEAPNLYAYDLEYFCISFLRAGIDQLKLPDLYDDIYPLAMIVSSFRSVYFEKQPVRLLELLMAIQDCLAICMIKRMSKVQEFICKQKYCLRYWFTACNCKAAEAIQVHLPETPDLFFRMFCQDEVEMEFDYFEDEKTCFNILHVSVDQSKLVHSEMVYLHVQRLLKGSIEKDSLEQVLAAYKNKSLDRAARKSFPFLMTYEELTTVANDILEKFKNRNSSRDTSIQLMKAERSAKGKQLGNQNYVELTTDAYDDCLEFLSGLLENSVEFEKYYPDRTAYIPYSEQPTTKPGETRLIVQSGEFLGLVKARMQRNPSSHFKSYWDYLSRKIANFQDPDKWALVYLTAIIQFGTTPIGLDKFCFVPNLQCMLKDLPKEVSTMIAGLNSKKTEVSAEDGGTEQDQLERVRMELARANESLKRQEGLISHYSEKFNDQTANIQQLQRRVDELSGTNLANTALIQVYTEEIGAKTAECEELRKKHAASEQEARLARQESDSTLEECKRNLAEMDKTVVRIERLNKTLLFEEAENKAKQQESKRILQQNTEAKAQLDKIQRENQKLQDVVKSEKQKLKTKEEQWKKETGKTIANKNAEIQKLKQQVLERENRVKNLQNNHETASRSIRADKETLERQLARATAKILDLEAPRAAQVDMDAQLAAAIQQNDQLIGENQYWQSQLRLEKMKSEQNGRLQERIQWLENQIRTRGTSVSPPTLPAPNAPSPLPQQLPSPDSLEPCSVRQNPPQSESSPALSPASLLPETTALNTEAPPMSSESATLLTPAPALSPAQTPSPSPPDSPECPICHEVMTPNSLTFRCVQCKNPFHESCINEWTRKYKATCPMCRSNFPNPQDFPPLGS